MSHVTKTCDVIQTYDVCHRDIRRHSGTTCHSDMSHVAETYDVISRVCASSISRRCTSFSYFQHAILLSPHKSLIDSEIKSLQQDFDLTDDGELQDYLGTRFTKHPNGSIELTQPRMIQRILDMVGLGSPAERVKMHDTPACDRHLLDHDPDGLPATCLQMELLICCR